MKRYIFNKMLSGIVSLFIIAIIILLGNYVSVKIISRNEFFMKHINMIKAENNIFDTAMLFTTKESGIVLKKYAEATVDSIIKFDYMPSIDDMVKFFNIPILIIKKNIQVNDFLIENNKVKILVTLNNNFQLKNFITELKNIKYIDIVQYKQIIIDNNKIVEITCRHNK